MALYYLFESASGFALFSSEKIEEIGGSLASIQESIASRKRFKKIVKLVAFQPFISAEQALANMQAISESECPADLVEFLKLNMPSVKKSKYILATEDLRLPSSINEYLPKLTCQWNESIVEVFRGIRLHFESYIEASKDLGRGQLGLAHAYSRSKVQHDVKRHDKHIIHAIALLDQTDKDLNTFCMRLKEWYSWHFPELYQILPDNILFTRAVQIVLDKSSIDKSKIKKLGKMLDNKELAQEIADTSNRSMGGDMSEVDTLQIQIFTEKIINLADFRNTIAEYLKEKMLQVAPNLSALIGEIVGARLISQAGGLFSLAKFPASTVQILGAEKALFRALKTRGNTPKYGLLYHSSFIGRAGAKDKGKISRYLANKCSIASRIDAFYPKITDAFGKRMNEQVEERLINVTTGERGAPNEDVMREVVELLKAEKTKKKRKKSE